MNIFLKGWTDVQIKMVRSIETKKKILLLIIKHSKKPDWVEIVLLSYTEDDIKKMFYRQFVYNVN